MKLFTRIKNITEHLFSKHLLVTNTSLGVFFLGLGDAIQQNIEKKMYPEKVYENRRTRNMMISGSIFGVGGHYWYRFLDTKFPGTTVKHVGKKLLLEMAIGPPVFLGFFITIGYLEGKPIQESFKEFKKNILVILAADWAIYAPLQAVNFFYVPPRYRLLYVCVLCLAYDIFMSYILHKEDNLKLASKKE
ncbi:mpv17-like protein 2 [Caerostris darwini]|uniref:Mpv17-like protein 2 n=1 Tax=Caerostris darwini TaxID=1538125 RepID=A0AAV4QFX5_9ARAC|nr:mpv17-like protein 2 [Caerostris darwini]